MHIYKTLTASLFVPDGSKWVEWHLCAALLLQGRAMKGKVKSPSRDQSAAPVQPLEVHSINTHTPSAHLSFFPILYLHTLRQTLKNMTEHLYIDVPIKVGQSWFYKPCLRGKVRTPFVLIIWLQCALVWYWNKGFKMTIAVIYAFSFMSY